MLVISFTFLKVYLQELKPEAIDLFVLYGEDKDRHETYAQITEVLLHYTRRGCKVVAVFYGHPGRDSTLGSTCAVCSLTSLLSLVRSSDLRSSDPWTIINRVDWVNRLAMFHVISHIVGQVQYDAIFLCDKKFLLTDLSHNLAVVNTLQIDDLYLICIRHSSSTTARTIFLSCVFDFSFFTDHQCALLTARVFLNIYQ